MQDSDPPTADEIEDVLLDADVIAQARQTGKHIMPPTCPEPGCTRPPHVWQHSHPATTVVMHQPTRGVNRSGRRSKGPRVSLNTARMIAERQRVDDTLEATKIAHRGQRDG